MKNWIFYLLICWAMMGCRFKELQLTSINGFTINKINTEGIDANLMLKIKNPNRFGFTILKSEVDLVYGGVKLGKASLQKPIKISANKELVYTFGLKSDFKHVNLIDVMKLMNGSSSSGIVEVKGDLICRKFLLKKAFPVSVKERIP